MAIKVYSPVDFEDTSSGLSIDGDFAVDTNTFFVDVSTNRVGVGTTSPSDILSINSSSSDTIIHLTNTSTGTTTADGLRLGMVGTNAYFLLRESASMLFHTNNTERMRITNGGNLLIGTTTDSGATVHIRESSSGQSPINSPSLFIENNGSSNSYYALQVATQGGGYSFNVTNAGNVGVGTNSPSSKLEVSSSTLTELKVTESGSSVTTMVQSSTSYGWIGTKTNHTMYIGSNDGAKITVLTSGDVGIGTTSPSHKLHVVGGNIFGSSNVLATNNVYAAGPNGFVFGSSTSEGEYIYRSGNDIRVYAGGSDRLTVLGTGNVGVGTTNPTSKTHVYYGGGTTNGLHVQASANRGKIAVSDNDTAAYMIAENSLASFGRQDALSANNLNITSGGNVLIGTTTESGEKLQVSGSTSLGGDVDIDGDLDFSGGDQNKIITGSQESYTLPAQGTRMRILTLTNGASCRVYLDSSENGYIQPIVLDIFYKSQSIGDKPQIVRVQNYQWHAHSNDIIFTSDGAASVGGVTHVYAEKVNHSTGRSVNIRKVEQFKGSVTILNGSTTDTNGGTDETISGEFAELKANGNIISTGNVLIGTTTDTTQRLQVNGMARFDSTVYVGEYITHLGDGDTALRFLDDSIQFNAGGVAMMKLTEGSADIVTINPDSADVNFQVNGDTVANLLFVDGGTSKVGIGTSSPAYRLDIKGTSNNIGDGNQIFSVGNTSGGTQLAIGSSEDSYTWIRSYESGVGGRDLALVTNNEAVRIKSGGNVLIGTTTDSGYKLDVSGAAQVSHTLNEIVNLNTTNANGGYTAYRASGTAKGFVGFGSTLFTGLDINNFGIRSQSGLALASGGGDVRLYINSSGNVGVGTTSPSQKLHVVGNVRIDDGYTLGWGADTTKIAGNSSANTLAFKTSSADRLYINSSGNVGINTTSPSSKLHIVGDLFLKGSDTSSSTKVFHVQTGNSTSIMDFRNNAYAFFGCGQGGGSASGFIFRYNSTFGVQFTGYNYGNGSSPSYKPILMDTDLAGRSQGVYVNYGITGYTAPAPTTTTEFAVRGRGTSTSYTAKFEDSSTNPLLYIKDNGNVTVGSSTDNGYKLDVNGNTNTNGDYYVNGNQGWSGTINIPTNPPISITVEGGIITNVT